MTLIIVYVFRYFLYTIYVYKKAIYYKISLILVGGRFVPKRLAAKYDLDLPVYPGSESCVKL